ncbi:MAG: redoxin domain-containing (seleno)protein, partial [Dehalococcoidia bacterium]
MPETFTVIEPGRECELRAETHGGRVLLDAGAVRRGLGWELKPEGFCRDGVCVPILEPARVLEAGAIDLSAFAALLRRPL